MELSQRLTPVSPSVYGRILLASGEIELVVIEGMSRLGLGNEDILLDEKGEWRMNDKTGERPEISG